MSIHSSQLHNVKSASYMMGMAKLFLALLLLFMARVWVLFNYNKLLKRLLFPQSLKRYIIAGQDRYFVMEPHQEHLNYPVVKFTFERPHYNAYKFIVDSLRPSIDDPVSKFRIIMDGSNKYAYRYTTAPTSAIIRYTFFRADNINDVDKTTLAYQAAVNPNKLKFIIANDGFIIAASHLVHDGVSIFNILTTFIKSSPLKLHPFRYIPIINEAYMIRSACMSLLFLHETLAIKRHITSQVPWTSGLNDSIILKTKVSIASIKKIKNTLVQLDTPLPFPLVFGAIQTMGLFFSSNVDRLTIGVTVGFDNDSRFNNFTAIPIVVKKPFQQLDSGNFITCMMDLMSQMYVKMTQFKHLIPAVYSVTNVYNVDAYVNDRVDVLMSGIPMCIAEQHRFDGINIESAYGTMPCHTSPVYILFLSDTKDAFTTQHIRTRDINVSQLEYFNRCLPDWLSVTEN